HLVAPKRLLGKWPIETAAFGMPRLGSEKHAPSMSISLTLAGSPRRRTIARNRPTVPRSSLREYPNVCHNRLDKPMSGSKLQVEPAEKTADSRTPRARLVLYTMA